MQFVTTHSTGGITLGYDFGHPHLENEVHFFADENLCNRTTEFFRFKIGS